MNTIINAIAKAKEIQFTPLERYFLEDTPCYWKGDVFLSDKALPGFAMDEMSTLAMQGVVPFELVQLNNLEGGAWMQAINERMKTALLPITSTQVDGDIAIPEGAFPPKGHVLYELFVLYGAMSLRVVVSEGEECILRTPKTEAAFDDAAKKMVKDAARGSFTFTDVVNVKKVNDETYARNAFRNEVSARNGFGAF